MTASSWFLPRLLFLLAAYTGFGYALYRGGTSAVYLWGLGLCLAFAVFAYGIMRGAPLPRGRLWVGLLLAAALMRLALWGAQPERLSDDVYRYLWDGKVQTHGINPYAVSPDSDTLRGLRDDVLYPRVAHKGSTAIYPPLSQWIFQAAYRIGRGALWPLRLLYLLLDMTVAFLVYTVTRDRQRTLLYLFCPLVIIEAYVGMHIDVAAMALLFAGYAVFRRGRTLPAVLLVAASVLIKYTTVVALPVFLLAYVRGRPAAAPLPHRCIKAAGYGALTVAVIAAAFLPFIWPSPGVVIQQLSVYMAYWHFNASWAALMRMAVGEGLPWLRYLLLTAALLLVYGAPRLAVRGRIALALMVFTAFSPAVFPWYLLPLVPFVAVRPLPGEMFLPAAAFISYAVLIPYAADGVWREPMWARWIFYIPFYLLWGNDIIRRAYVQAHHHRGHYSRAE